MLKRSHVAVAAFILAIVGALWLAKLSPSYRECDANRKQDPASHESANSQKERDRRFVICEGTFFDANREAITAGATIAIAIFTLVLWLATDRQARLSREAIELGNRQYIATHRPRLRVRQILFDGFSDAEIFLAWVYVVNVGANPAVSIRFDAVFVQRHGSIRQPPWIENLSPDNKHGRTELVVGALGAYEPSRPAYLLPFESKEIRSGDRTLMLIGRIHYIDSIGTERQTGFGWTYDVGLGEFRKPKGEDEYNYED